MAKLKSKKSKLKNSDPISQIFLQKTASLYVFMMLAIYPLYYQDKYFNMGEAKWLYFKNVSLVFLCAAALGIIWHLGYYISKGKIKEYLLFAKDNMILTDWFVAAYLIFSCLSALMTPYKDGVLIGYDGWYMGLISQIGFVVIYFFISRFWRWDGPALIAYIAVAAAVFIFGIIMRFHIDPMEMYEGLDEMYVRKFLSTLGQATWYSSYMCLIFPLGVYAFWLYDERWKRILFGIFTGISFMTLVTQNSDSAYLALAGITFILFWKSMESNKGFMRFLEVMIIAFASFKFMGICRLVFSEAAVKIDAISVFVSESIFTWVVLAVLIGLYVIAKIVLKLDNEAECKIDISKYKIIRVVFLGIIIAALIAGIIYIYLNTTGKLPENLSSDNNYLVFDIHWGNNRGVSWKAAVYTLVHCDIMRKLFGAGPDCFASLVYSFRESADTINSIFGENTILTCCHNEWLNVFVNEGILGGVAYIGLFVCAIRRYMKSANVYPEVFAVAMAIVGYMCHNFFCYQQIICTPTIFLLMGCAEALIRNGYYYED